MKRSIAFILALVMCLGLTACGSKPVQSQIENFEKKTNVELAIEAVNTLLGSKEYKEKNGAFETATGSESRAPEVSYVMEYKNDSFDGFALHLLLIDLKVDYAVEDGFNDRTTLVVDLTNGSWCDEIRSDFGKWQDSFQGVCESIEDCYFIFLQPTFVEAGQNGSIFWSESETYNVLSEVDLKQINGALNN